MRAARLVQWCGLFGVSEGTVRVALSRMVDRGELHAAGGTYELAGRVGARRSAQDWSLRPKTLAWRGQWSMALVGDALGARRIVRRCAKRCAGLASRNCERASGPGPTICPASRPTEETWSVIDAQCARWRGRPDDDPAPLVSTLFATQPWTRRAASLTKRLTAAAQGVGSGSERALADAFAAGAAGLAHIRSDPLLPPALGASAAAGDALRAAYGAYEAAFAPALQAWFRAQT